MVGARRVRFAIGSTVVLAGWVVTAALTQEPALVVTAPVAGALWVLQLLDSGYLLGRQWAHRRRRRADQDRRTAWAPAPGVRPPIDYPNVLPRPAGEAPVDAQGRYRATGIRLAVLPALAVVFLTLQTLFFGHGPLGLGFVLAQCLLLVVMIWTVWTEQEPSRPWVTSRVRAELFRREMFLLLAGVGPYLGRSDQEAETVRDTRLAVLAGAGPAGLDRFALLVDRNADGAETHWQDEVWRRAPAAGADTTERVRTYLDHRIRRQSLFFELAAGKCVRTEDALGRVAKGAVLATVAVALAYAALLVPDRGGRQLPLTATVIALLAAGLPPLCNTVLAVQNLFASQRLAASYQETRQELLGHESTLRKLLAEPDGPDRTASFLALVLRVEATLTEEVRRWRIIVARPEYDAGL